MKKTTIANADALTYSDRLKVSPTFAKLAKEIKNLPSNNPVLLALLKWRLYVRTGFAWFQIARDAIASLETDRDALIAEQSIDFNAGRGHDAEKSKRIEMYHRALVPIGETYAKELASFYASMAKQLSAGHIISTGKNGTDTLFRAWIVTTAENGYVKLSRTVRNFTGVLIPRTGAGIGTISLKANQVADFLQAYKCEWEAPIPLVDQLATMYQRQGFTVTVDTIGAYSELYNETDDWIVLKAEGIEQSYAHVLTLDGLLFRI